MVIIHFSPNIIMDHRYNLARPDFSSWFQGFQTSCEGCSYLVKLQNYQMCPRTKSVWQLNHAFCLLFMRNTTTVYYDLFSLKIPGWPYVYILTSKRNASSKTLYSLLHEHHTCAKGWSILIFVCVSLNDILKILGQYLKISKLGGPTILKGHHAIMAKTVLPS